MKRAGGWLAVLGVVAGILVPTDAQAAAPSPEQRRRDIATEVQRLQQELGEAAEQEAGLIAELEVTRRLRQDLDARLAELDGAIRAAEEELARLDRELAAARLEEVRATGELRVARRRLQQATDQLREQAVDAFIRFGTMPDFQTMALDVDEANELGRLAAYVDALADKQAAVVLERQRLQGRTTLLQAQAADAAARMVTHQEAAAHRKTELEAARAEQEAAKAELAAEAALEQQLLGQVQARRSEYQRRILQLEQESSDIAALLRRHQADQSVTPSGKGVLGSPLASPVVTSTFGYRMHPIFGDRRLHAGIDLRAATGTPVYASGAGVVVWAGHRGGYGNTVVISHGGSLATLYAHNSSLLVSVGDTVSRGQPIARAGSTGNSTGPHLHFEVRVGGTPVDPLRYL